MGDDSETEDGTKITDPPKPEVKVVLEKASGNGSQPDIDAIVRGRVNKLNARFDAKSQQANQLTGDLATANQRNEMLQMQVEQLKSRPSANPVVDVPPDPNDFDDGASDPKYITALNGYSDNRVSAVVQQQLAAQKPQQQPQQGNAAQRQHYQRAHDSGIDNFEALEAKAIDILGEDYARVIIDTAPNSEQILAYLGSNPDIAQYHKDQIDTNAAKGVWELASLRFADTASQPNPPPDPDTPLTGVSPTTSDDYEKRLAALRKTAGDTGNMKALMAFKRENQRPAAA